jgi:hypothetical protein
MAVWDGNRHGGSARLNLAKLGSTGAERTQRSRSLQFSTAHLRLWFSHREIRSFECGLYLLQFDEAITALSAQEHKPIFVWPMRRRLSPDDLANLSAMTLEFWVMHPRPRSRTV